jgi:cation diffusion facilitator CzcD-associated flavoprotein CzcO
MLDVVIVGAGAAGVGCGVLLRRLGVKQFALLERYEVGASFARWPQEMRFITPSFTSNGFNLLDLNAIALGTSPAYGLRREHPSGLEYADYLQAVAQHSELPVRTGVDVRQVRPLVEEAGFLLCTSRGPVHSRFVIWAAGEFQYPHRNGFSGAELCIHNSQVRSWAQVKGDECIVIGGCESGLDAAINLCALGKRVRVLDSIKIWEQESSDPSLAVSPYTYERLEAALRTKRLLLTGNAGITEVRRTPSAYQVTSEDGRRWRTKGRPILATGFTGGHHLIADLFDWREDGQVKLSTDDESLRTPGLFLVGPGVRHEKIIFCFIYKFRQRFAVVANAIATRLQLDTTPLKTYRERGMFLEDLSCCAEPCAC